MKVKDAPNFAILRHDPPVKMIPPFQKVESQTYWVRGGFSHPHRTGEANVNQECSVIVVEQLDKELPMCP